MHKFFSLIIGLAVCGIATAQPKRFSFSGYTGIMKDTILHISSFAGSDVKVNVKADGSFSVSNIEPENGFYNMEPIGTIYLKPGFHLQVRPVQGVRKYAFSGSGAIENNSLLKARTQYGDFIPLNSNGNLTQDALYMDPPEFLRQTEAFKREGEKLFSESKDSFFRQMASADLAFFARKMMHQYMNGFGKDKEKSIAASRFFMEADKTAPDFKQKLDSLFASSTVKKMDSTYIRKINHILWEDWDKQNEVLFRQSDAYRTFVNWYLSNKVLEQIDRDSVSSRFQRDEKRVSVIKQELRNPYIREYHLSTTLIIILETASNRQQLDKYHKEFMANITGENRRRRAEEIYQSAITFVNGAPAPNFTFQDISGKKVSLESLRGKYVYIDLWATWCIPCKAEIPYLQKVEADYHGKNIAFVSISTDKQSDFPKWEEYVKKNGLGGIQLIADKSFESDFVKSMNVIFIPRFILIDPEGKLLLSNAPRPSEKELRVVLDKLPGI